MPGSPRDSILPAATLPTISSAFSIAGQGRHYLGGLGSLLARTTLHRGFCSDLFLMKSSNIFENHTITSA